MIISCELSPEKDVLVVKFLDDTFKFHAQWLRDARCDNGPSRDAESAFCQQPLSNVSIEEAYVVGTGFGSTVDVTWKDGLVSRFPAPWLRVMAPLVARAEGPTTTKNQQGGEGWLPETLRIPEISYQKILGRNATTGETERYILDLLDMLLQDSSSGIVKITDLPAPNIEDERNKTNNIVTQVLKAVFGSVFQHSRREPDQTFNVASHNEADMNRAAVLPNYDTKQVLLPHVDHAHYTHPIQVQGWYCLEGESENTFVSGLAALSTLRSENPELFEQLCKAPMSVGRVVHYYNPSMYQGTVDTAVTLVPGDQQKVKRIRWHPHLTGSLLTTYDQFKESRRAHERFQEIMRRDSHLLKVILKPGDLYIWNNFRILHGRERVLEVPRTGVGQTVPEQVVADKYRALQFNRLKDHIDEKWLVHMPTAQLSDMNQIKDGEI